MKNSLALLLSVVCSASAADHTIKGVPSLPTAAVPTLQVAAPVLSAATVAGQVAPSTEMQAGVQSVTAGAAPLAEQAQSGDLQQAELSAKTLFDGATPFSGADEGAAEAGLPSRLSGVGPRGLLGYEPANTPENAAKVENLGGLWWYTKVFFVADKAAALAQEKLSENALDLTKPEDKRSPNVHMRSVYVLDPSIKIRGDHEKSEFARIAATIPDRPVYEVRDGQLVPLDAALVKSRFNPATMVPMVQFEGEGAHIRAFGWHFTNPFGVFLLDDMNPATSKTFKKLEADARARFYPATKFDPATNKHVAATKRLTITFNQDLRGVMTGAQHQERKGQPMAANRVNEAMIQGFEKMLAAGKAVSVEVWEETAKPEGGVERRLVAGVFGANNDGMVAINSIYYGDEPDLARFAFLALRDRLKAAGFTFMPAVMVSTWSATIKGKLISGAEAMRLIDGRPRGAKVDFTSEYGPDAAPEIRNRPFGQPGVRVPDLRKTR